jgi:hypothetical protein
MRQKRRQGCSPTAVGWRFGKAQFASFGLNRCSKAALVGGLFALTQVNPNSRDLTDDFGHGWDRLGICVVHCRLDCLGAGRDLRPAIRDVRPPQLAVPIRAGGDFLRLMSTSALFFRSGKSRIRSSPPGPGLLSVTERPVALPPPSKQGAAPCSRSDAVSNNLNPSNSA